jgi:hypothetical protein
MAHVVSIYAGSPLRLADGRVYVAQACGREREDGMWEGWLEFVPDDGSVVLRSERETTQPNLVDLEYWATGLTPVYLQGALERTLTPRVAPAPPPVVPSVYDTPAPPSTAVVAEPPVVAEPRVEPVLNPFAVYAKGEELLRRQLGALSARHLRSIAVGYELIDSSDVELQAMTEVELIDLIVDAVSRRRAA